jgi:hypothetical protein
MVHFWTKTPIPIWFETPGPKGGKLIFVNIMLWFTAGGCQCNQVSLAAHGRGGYDVPME